MQVGNASVHVDVTSTSLSADGVLAEGEEHVFAFAPPPESGFVVVDVSGTGDVDLFTEEGADPTPEEYDCASQGEGSDELCIHARVDGLLYVKLIGWARSSVYSLEIVFRGIGTTPGGGS